MIRSIGRLSDGRKSYIVNESVMVVTDLPTTCTLQTHHMDCLVILTRRDSNGEFTTDSPTEEVWIRFRETDSFMQLVATSTQRPSLTVPLTVWKSNPCYQVLQSLVS